MTTPLFIFITIFHQHGHSQQGHKYRHLVVVCCLVLLKRFFKSLNYRTMITRDVNMTWAPTPGPLITDMSLRTNKAKANIPGDYYWLLVGNLKYISELWWWWLCWYTLWISTVFSIETVGHFLHKAHRIVQLRSPPATQGYRGGGPIAVQAWQPCPLLEPSPSHPILV